MAVCCGRGCRWRRLLSFNQGSLTLQGYPSRWERLRMTQYGIQNMLKYGSWLLARMTVEMGNLRIMLLSHPLQPRLSPCQQTCILKVDVNASAHSSSPLA